MFTHIHYMMASDPYFCHTISNLKVKAITLQTIFLYKKLREGGFRSQNKAYYELPPNLCPSELTTMNYTDYVGSATHPHAVTRVGSQLHNPQTVTSSRRVRWPPLVTLPPLLRSFLPCGFPHQTAFNPDFDPQSDFASFIDANQNSTTTVICSPNLATPGSICCCFCKKIISYELNIQTIFMIIKTLVIRNKKEHLYYIIYFYIHN